MIEKRNRKKQTANKGDFELKFLTTLGWPYSC